MKCAFGENPKGCYGQGKKQSPMTRMAVAGLLRELLMRTIRYRDDKGNTWTGRGKQPVWLRDRLASGATLGDFLLTAGA